MTELKDYSGELKPGIRYEDLSKESLVKLAKTYGRLYLLLHNFWQRTTIDRHGLGEVVATEIEIWKQQGKYEPRWICKALNIQGDDVISWMKMLQFAPLGWVPESFDYHWDIKSKDHMIVTIDRCFAAAAWEKEGDTEKIKHYCNNMEPPAFQAIGTAFNPKMKVTAVKVPPRTSDKDCYCIWDFKIER